MHGGRMRPSAAYASDSVASRPTHHIDVRLNSGGQSFPAESHQEMRWLRQDQATAVVEASYLMVVRPLLPDDENQSSRRLKSPGGDAYTFDRDWRLPRTD